MGILDKIFGGDEPQRENPATQRSPETNSATSGKSEDEAAIERYRYMLKTAPPETIEQAHAEAFAKLTPEQRQMVLQQLNENLPEAERQALANNGDNPQALARAATRAEMRQPGTMERSFGGAGGMGFGGMLAGSLLGSIAGTVIGSYVAQQFFADDAGSSDSVDNSGGEQQSETPANEGDSGQEDFADAGGGFGDFGGGDF